VANAESPADPDFVNPCDYLAPCVLELACSENQDTAVTFNLTVMRDADQGFFDVAVNFEDIFCSAKVDSCYSEAGEDPGFIELLFDENGDRVETAVMATACSAGTDDANTVMWMSHIEVACNGGAVKFTIDPTGDNSNDSNTDGQPGDDCIDLAYTALYRPRVHRGQQPRHAGAGLCDLRRTRRSVRVRPTAMSASTRSSPAPPGHRSASGGRWARAERMCSAERHPT